MTVARKLADLVTKHKSDEQLRRTVERLIVQMDGLFSKLPKGISIDLSELAMEVFNQACYELKDLGSKVMIPANIIGQACTAVSNRKAAK